MLEPQATEPGRSGTNRVAVVLGVTLAALALAAALFVVARSLRRVRPEPLPPSLKTAPPDTGLVFFRANVRRKTLNLSARCEYKRKQLAGKMTPAQDSLSRECDSAIAVVLSRIAAFDTVSRSNRKAGADSVRAAYDRAKIAVRVFTRSGLQSDLVSEDSLNQEIKKLISE
jgi:hypothetical protein